MRRNRGSTTVEMSVLAPIFLGVIYLYIMFFVSFIGYGGEVYDSVNGLYGSVAEGGSLHEEGSGTDKVVVTSDKGILNYELRYERRDGNVVKRMRRWQLAVSALS